MRYLRHHAADRRCIRPCNHLIQAGKAKPPNHLLLLHRCADRRTDPLELQRGSAFVFAPGHHHSSSADLPRVAATSSLLFSLFSASKVALITLCGLVVPIDLVRTFCTPADVITARTAPPAITPVPSGAGLSSTRPEPNVPSTVCGIDVLLRLTFTRFFLADSIPLRMACGTSLALPEP